MSSLFCIDIDGTIAHAGRRFEKAGPEPDRGNKQEYDAWVARVQDERSLLSDEPVPGMLALMNALYVYTDIYSRAITPVYLTSREEKWRLVTEEWLTKHKFPPFELVMRGNADYSEGHELKEGLIKQLAYRYRCDTVVILDDDEHKRLEEVAMRNGWTFLKARSGGQK